MPTPEDPVKQEIIVKLKNLTASGDVIWWSRLQCGKVEIFGGFIQLCELGTFDFLCAFCNKKGGLSMLFIDAKRPDQPPKMNDNQVKFYNQFKDKHPDLTFMLAQSGSEVSKRILSLAYDRMADIVF